MQSWLEGRIWVGKGAQATGMTASLRIQSSKADSNTWESFTRSGLKLESEHQESTTLRRLQEKGYQATSEPETTSEASYLGCGEKELDCCSVVQSPLFRVSKFCISFGNQGPRVWRKSGEAQNPCCLKSSVKFPQSDDLGCRVICWCWSTVFSEVRSQHSHLPGNFRALPCFLLLTSFMEMLISFSSRTWHLPTLPKVPKAGSMTMVLLCLIGQQTRLTWTS